MVTKSSKVFEKRPYQTKCLKALKNAFTAGVLSALFVLATGLGKTYVALQFLKWLLKQITGERSGKPRRPRVLVLCHQKTILRQLLKEFRGILGRAFTYEMLDTTNRRNLPDVDILFASFQAMRTHRRRFPKNYFDVLLVDEGHHSKADSYEATIRYFKTRFRYAMTATPNRMDLREIEDLFGEAVYEKRLAKALAEKLLPEVCYKLFLETSAKSVREALGGKKPTRKNIDRHFFQSEAGEQRDKEIARTIVAEMGKIKNPRVIVFCQSIRHCNRMTTYLTELGVRAAAVHSDIDEYEQENRLEGLKSGELEVLVARDVLNEGKDIPAVNLVAVVRATVSKTIFEQQIGRGLRPGKARLTVLDFVANCDRIAQIAQLVQEVRDLLNRKRKSKRGGAREDNTFSVLSGKSNLPLPIQVSAGDLQLDFVYRDLVKVLESITKWTRESGKAALLALAKELGKKTLTHQNIIDGYKDGVCPGNQWFVSNFAPNTEGIAEALEAIGLESEEEWTPETGKAALLKLAKALKVKTLTYPQIVAAQRRGEIPSKQWIVKYFAPKTGLLVEALKAIGLEANDKWTIATGKAAYRALAKTLGVKRLSKPQISAGSKKGECPSITWLIDNLAPKTRRLAEGLKALGLKSKPKWTRETGKAAFLALAKKLGKKTLTQPEIIAGCKAEECPGSSWLCYTFDPKNKCILDALFAIGLKERAKWTPETGAAALRALAKKLGKTSLSQDDINAGGKAGDCPGTGWFLNNFAPKTESLKDALKAIGLTVGERRRRSR